MSGSRHTSARTPTRDDRRAQVYATAASAGMPSVGRIADRMAKVGRTRVVVSENPTASGFCLCLPPHCGRVLECHSPHAAMSAGFHFPFSRPSIQEALLSVRLQLLFSASTLQALYASELRKRPSCASTRKESDVGIAWTNDTSE